MATVFVRKGSRGNGGHAKPERPRAPALVHAAVTSSAADPFEPIVAGGPRPWRPVGFSPAFELRETGGAYVLKADLPGVKDEHLEVSLQGDRLRVSGRREVDPPDPGDAFCAAERGAGAFARTFTLPATVDPGHLSAELRDGVLRIEIEKKPSPATKHVRIAGSSRRSKA